ncbi:MAG: hypothetical protein COB67_02370 [SAR324 cluster bacterium]|uniref:Peptidase M50 domain-containing protein n=1 Tax=SAR324 cluster bacterium TaxID=2024889 RepID=A0A2A4TA03_9DELT|nr:MAG: hypothetical protein COB67_02370 [SAR324 cluster bacterium]
MNRVRFFIKTIFYLPGTFLHEFLHYIGAKILGMRNVSISLLPKVGEGPEVIMGSVNANLSSNHSSLRWLVPALLPKAWWIVLYFLISYYGWVEISIEENAVYFYPENIHNQLEDYIIGYIAMQLFWAGSLSFQDWKVAMHSLVSVKGMLLIGGGYIFYTYVLDGLLAF